MIPPMQQEGGHLPRWPFSLDPDKAVEAVVFLIPRIKDPSLHSVAKTLYHADKMHLSRYGRPVTGDWYVAMKFGPVPSATYDILKTLRGDAKLPVPERARNAIEVIGDYKLRANREADETVLSVSERECLKASADEHGAKSFTQRTAESHGPAWEAAEENGLIRLENLLLELENQDELRCHFLDDT